MQSMTQAVTIRGVVSPDVQPFVGLDTRVMLRILDETFVLRDRTIGLDLRTRHTRVDEPDHLRQLDVTGTLAGEDITGTMIWNKMTCSARVQLHAPHAWFWMQLENLCY